MFDSRLFSLISFPKAPEYPIRAVLNFFGNSQRVQLKVHRHGAPVSLTLHRWQKPQRNCTFMNSASEHVYANDFAVIYQKRMFHAVF
jgi:hypothetical protein